MSHWRPRRQACWNSKLLQPQMRRGCRTESLILLPGKTTRNHGDDEQADVRGEGPVPYHAAFSIYYSFIYDDCFWTLRQNRTHHRSSLQPLSRFFWIWVIVRKSSATQSRRHDLGPRSAFARLLQNQKLKPAVRLPSNSTAPAHNHRAPPKNHLRPKSAQGYSEP